MKETEIQKKNPPHGAGTCTHGRSCHQQSWCCTDVAFRRRHLGNIKRAVCIFRSFHTRIAWNLDLYISGTSGAKSHDPAEKFVPQYLFSFVVGFAFSELLDVHESWINVLPLTPGYRVIYFLISYILLCIGIALSNRCKLPIIPTDLFPRELSDITSVTYSKIKVGFDVTCLAVTAGLTFAFLGHLDGLGIGTILAAFTMGKVIGLIGKWMDRHACFVSFMTQRQTA